MEEKKNDEEEGQKEDYCQKSKKRGQRKLQNEMTLLLSSGSIATPNRQRPAESVEQLSFHFPC